MAKESVLGKVYGAIGQLRAQGFVTLNVDQVANAAGLARSTFYLKDPDWIEVREVIKGKPSTRVRLVDTEISSGNRTMRKLDELHLLAENVESELDAVKETAETIYRKLIDQLQYYFALSSETPAKKNQQTRLLKDLSQANHQVKRLQDEVAFLKEQVRQAPHVPALVSKRYITLDDPLVISDYYSSFLDQLLIVIPDENQGKMVGGIFVMCGLPLAGKTRWIHDHQPLVPGIAIYVDGTSHTADIRKFIVDRFRRVTAASINCVRIRTDKKICIERSGRKLRGASHIQMEHTIDSVENGFEEVSLVEPFDSIILA